MTSEVKASIHQVLGTAYAKSLMGTRRPAQDGVSKVTGVGLFNAVLRNSALMCSLKVTWADYTWSLVQFVTQ